jgi:hypothetical protein
MSSIEITLPVGLVDEDGKVINKVQIKEITAKVKKDLAKKQNLESPENVENSILQACIESMGSVSPVPQETIQKLYSADRDFIILKIRQISFGDKINGSYKCHSCGENLSTDMSIDKDFSVYGLPPVNEENTYTLDNGQKVRVFTIKEPESGIELLCRYDTGLDRSRAAQMGNKNPLEIKMHLIRLCVISLTQGQKKIPGPLSLTYIENLPSRVWDYISIDWDSNQPGVDFNIEVSCATCSASTMWELNPRDFFSVPKVASRSDKLMKLSGI